MCYQCLLSVFSYIQLFLHQFIICLSIQYSFYILWLRKLIILRFPRLQLLLLLQLSQKDYLLLLQREFPSLSAILVICTSVFSNHFYLRRVQLVAIVDNLNEKPGFHFCSSEVHKKTDSCLYIFTSFLTSSGTCSQSSFMQKFLIQMVIVNELN